MAIQPDRRTGSWASTIIEQRQEIGIVLRASPSLRPTILRVVALSYRNAIKRAAPETGLPDTAFPASCVWTPDEILDEDWMPGG